MRRINSYLELRRGDNFSDNFSEDNGCWPLSERIRDNLLMNRESLVELLDTDDDLYGTMMQTNCFNKNQLEDIRTIAKLSDRNRKVLDMLSRRSQDHFNQFKECLTKTQPHLVPLLTGGFKKHHYIVPYIIKLITHNRFI